MEQLGYLSGEGVRLELSLRGQLGLEQGKRGRLAALKEEEWYEQKPRGSCWKAGSQAAESGSL